MEDPVYNQVKQIVRRCLGLSKDFKVCTSLALSFVMANREAVILWVFWEFDLMSGAQVP